MSMIDGRKAMWQRIYELDSDPGGGVLADIDRFIDVMEAVTNTSMPGSEVSVDNADTAQSRSRLLQRLEQVVPEIVRGPLRLDAQYWVGKSNYKDRAKSRLVPSKESFREFLSAPDVQQGVKPFHVGLFTSTGILDTYGMWKKYITPYAHSSLYPLPWAIWSLQPRNDVKVCEISSAHHWEAFVVSYSRSENGLIYPDWMLAAKDYDALHMTLRAIAAIQGFYLKSPQGLIAPSYWDVETTFWLRWCFSSAHLVEMVR